MSNDKAITLEQLFRFNRGLPHQLAAITELQEDIAANGYAAAMRRDRPWFATWSQSGKQPEAIYLAPAQALIKQWEGLRLSAYADPASGGAPWTIGYGFTAVNSAPVREGDKISQALADELLRSEIHRYAAELYKLIPAMRQYGANQQAALISYAWNVGLNGVAQSTLRKRLLAGESAQVVVPQELPKWNKASGKVMEGLANRRAAEVAVFTGKPPLQQSAPRFTPASPFSTRVTPHVTYGELCLGEDRRRFRNQGQCDIASELCVFIEKARAQFGNKPVIITSGHRPPAVNQAVGGASNSEHLYKPGCGAIDWYIQGVPVKTVQDWCVKNWPYSTGLGAPQFIHTGVRAGRPKVVWNYL
jgi:GH24 family phage-related lysozyme (muramidase)